MGNFEILLIVLVSLTVGAAIYDGFLQLTGRQKAKPPKVNWRKNWAGVYKGHMSPPKPPSRPNRPKAAEDNWIRDGSLPPQDGKHDTMSVNVLVELPFDQQGVGYWDPNYECWVVTNIARHERRIDKILAWQKFPDYEKI